MINYGSYESGLYLIAKADSVLITKRVFENNRFMQRITGTSNKRQEADMKAMGLRVGRMRLRDLVKQGDKARALNMTFICVISAYWHLLGVHLLICDFEFSGLPVGIPARGLVPGDHWKHKPVNMVTRYLKSQLIPPVIPASSSGSIIN